MMGRGRGYPVLSAAQNLAFLRHAPPPSHGRDGGSVVPHRESHVANFPSAPLPPQSHPHTAGQSFEEDSPSGMAVNALLIAARAMAELGKDDEAEPEGANVTGQ